MASNAFQFHPELFEHRETAMAWLADAEFDWFSHYSAVDLDHHAYGLEVCGIRERADAEAMMELLERALPGWRAG